MKRFASIMAVAAAITSSVALAGPYAPAGGKPGATAILPTDSRIVEWAAGATIVRGLRKIDDPNSGLAFFGGATGDPANSAPVGAPPSPLTAYDAVALGQGGTVTLTFNSPISHAVGLDGSGYDFAVFSNGFSVNGGTQVWAKPAFVDVSSDGVNFFRFPSVSLTPTATQVNSFGTIDPTNLYDLAGKDPAGYGTPFNLGELAGVSPLLNIYAVTQIRLVDCVGDINPAYGTRDSQGHIVNGPWPASSLAGSEGFCLAGVAVLHDQAGVAAQIDDIYAHFGSASNTKWNVNGDALPVGQADVDSEINNVLHTVYGDANLDHKVNFSDFQVILNNWQMKNMGWAGGDFNGDGLVNFCDFQLMLDNWNPVGVAGSQVPEPCTTAILALGGLALIRKGGRPH